jgi:hypothetical protein
MRAGARAAESALQLARLARIGSAESTEKQRFFIEHLESCTGESQRDTASEKIR